jgi:hypothetical protein
MEALIHIETYSVAAYRAIRPAIVASGIGYFGVSGLLISARIKIKDYSYLVAVVNQAAECAGVDRSEYSIVLMEMLKA